MVTLRKTPGPLFDVGRFPANHLTFLNIDDRRYGKESTKAGIANLETHVASAYDLPLEDESVDRAFLVTVSTNIGWTPLFSRAAAIVTDVGAPFSHAAIVARELGIPAVIGCCNATMHLQSGV